jgi:hypothetical protein
MRCAEQCCGSASCDHMADGCSRQCLDVSLPKQWGVHLPKMRTLTTATPTTRSLKDCSRQSLSSRLGGHHETQTLQAVCLHRLRHAARPKPHPPKVVSHIVQQLNARFAATTECITLHKRCCTTSDMPVSTSTSIERQQSQSLNVAAAKCAAAATGPLQMQQVTMKCGNMRHASKQCSHPYLPSRNRLWQARIALHALLRTTSNAFVS